MALHIEGIGENQLKEFVSREFRTGSVAHSELSDADIFNIYHRNNGDSSGQPKLISESIANWIVEKSSVDFDCAIAAVDRLKDDQDSRERCANFALGLASSSENFITLHQVLSMVSVEWKERAEDAIENKILGSQWNEFLELQSYYFDITNSEEISKRIASAIESLDPQNIQFLTSSRLNAQFTCNVEATLSVDGDDWDVEEEKCFQAEEVFSGTWDISERHSLTTFDYIQEAIEIVQSRPSDFFKDRIGEPCYNYDFDSIVLGADEDGYTDEEVFEGLEILEIENEAYLWVNDERVISAEYDDYFSEMGTVGANISGEGIADVHELSHWGLSPGMPKLRYVFEMTLGATSGQFYLGEENKVVAIEFLKILLRKYSSL